MAVGDVMLDRYVGRAISRYGLAYPLARVKPILDKADLVVGNLECPITDQPRVLQKHFLFRASPSHTSALKGFDVLSVANNHSLDCGIDGLWDTVSNLSKLQIAAVGTLLEPVTLTKNGIRVAFLAFSDFREKLPISREDTAWTGQGGNVRYGREVVDYYDRDRLSGAIGKAKKIADVVVVIAHWGIEGDAKPSARQRKEAKELAAAGADLILGAHPHVLQPVERIGKTVVAYSMGNFVFDSTRTAERKAAIFSFSVTKSGVESWKLIPCRIENARPIPDH